MQGCYDVPVIITNSLGSNYSTSHVRSALSLFLHPREAIGAAEKLRRDLTTIFGIPKDNVALYSKGRHALVAALEHLGIGPGDEVIIQAFTCAVLPEAILKLGATPVYADIAPRSLNHSLDLIKKAATRQSKALILQHTLGVVNPETEAIVRWCQDQRIAIIQDLAHALGAPVLKKARPFVNERPGLFSRSEQPIVLSFSQDKVIDGVSGGALISPRPIRTLDFSRNEDIGSIKKLLLYPFITMVIRQTYQFGIGKVIHVMAKQTGLLPSPLDAPARSTPLPDPLAALAYSQLLQLSDIAAHRRRIAQIYDEKLVEKVKMITSVDIENGTNLRYPIWVESREKLEKQLKHHGFYLLDHWYDAPVSPSWHPASSSYRQGSCPNAEDLSRRIFNLPTHVNISPQKARELVVLINTFIDMRPKVVE